MFAVFVYQKIRPRGFFTLDALYADIDVVQTSVESRGVGLQGAGYDVRSKFARGGISAAADTVVCFGLTADSTEAERAELISIS